MPCTTDILSFDGNDRICVYSVNAPCRSKSESRIYYYVVTRVPRLTVRHFWTNYRTDNALSKELAVRLLLSRVKTYTNGLSRLP